MNLICIPFAYREGMNSGVNISGGDNIKSIFKKCWCCIGFSKVL